MLHSSFPPSLRVLYVEDDTNTQEEVAFFLEPLVQELYLASNGQEGYALYESHKPDLIITDIQMPLMNGIEMIKQIRQSDQTTPIFITTAYNETNYLLNAINSGVNRYILKPINFKTLSETLSDFYANTENDACTLSIDRNGVITHATNTWQNLTGYTLDELRNTPLERYIAPDDLLNYQQCLANIDAAYQHLKQTIRFLHKKGDTIEVVLHALHSHNAYVQLEFKTLDGYIRDTEILHKTLKTERFSKALIKMNSAIYKAIAEASEKNLFLEHLAALFTYNDPFEFSFVTYADENNLLTIAEQGKHKSIDLKTLFPDPIVIDEVECPMAEVIMKQQIIVIEDLLKFDEFLTKAYWVGKGIKSMVILPLHQKSKSQKKGAFCLMLNKKQLINTEAIDLFSNITEALNMGLQSIDNHKEREKMELLLRQELIERKRNEQIIQKLAFYDPLTLLPNRRLLSDYLNKAMASAKRNNRFSALLFMDLDNFKPLNDTYGHSIGDLLLIEVAKRISDTLRENDVVARFGGDEFVVIAQELSDELEISIEHARITAEKIRIALEKPYYFPLHNTEESPELIEHRCTTSIGITLFGTNSTSESELIKQADIAMYQAKTSGGNRYHFYSKMVSA